ncbi:uncharacterized protein LOC143018529 [Oratosquilla oratoria]|uniref:uncharacterized protein LOC143018529 n=1 Tax=Oratosquilla oratoria TaxID=337810 RepID=UPI003F76853E
MSEVREIKLEIPNEMTDEEERPELSDDQGNQTKDKEGHDVGNAASEIDSTTPARECVIPMSQERVSQLEIPNEMTDEEERPELSEDHGNQTQGEEGHDEHHDTGNVALESDLTTLGRWCGIVRPIIILGLMHFLNTVAGGILNVGADILEPQRICRVNLGYSEDECDHMDTNHSDVQAAVQQYQNTLNDYRTPIGDLLPLFLHWANLFFDGFRDSRGRKLLMVFVLGGFVGLALFYLLMSLNPHWPVEVLCAASFVEDITGSRVFFNMVVNSYMADITTPETRTKRMGFVNAVWHLGSPIGKSLGYWIYQYLGFAGVFITSAVPWIVCFLYTLFMILESHRPE